MTSIGLVGLGYWGKNHYKTLREMPGVSIPFVCDPVADGSSLGPEFIRDYRDAARRKGVDGVVVATPATTHYEVVKEFLNAGKHVLVEKPITTNLAQGKELCDLADERERVLMVGEIFRFNPAINYIMEHIGEGKIGDVKYFEARRIGLGPIRQDVGVVWDLASHDVYLANMFMRSLPERVGCHQVSFNGSVGDVATLALQFPGNRFGSIYVNWAHPLKERTIIIGGSRGAFAFDDIDPTDKVKHYERGVDYQPGTAGLAPFMASVRSGDIHIPSINLRGSPLERELRHFADCIDGKEKCMISGREGLKSLAVLAAADESIKRNGQEVVVMYG